MKVSISISLIFTFLFLIFISASSQYVGIRTSYHLHIDNIDTCNLFDLAVFNDDYGTCISNNVDAQPNCTIYITCLQNADNSSDFSNCLELSTTLTYVSYTSYNATYYVKTTYSDENCTSATGSEVLAFACAHQVFGTVNSTACGVDRLTLVTLNSTASAVAPLASSSFLFDLMF